MKSLGDADAREQLVRFIVEVQQIAEPSVTDGTLVSFGAFRRFRDWVKERCLLKRGRSLEWRKGMTVSDVVWLFNESKKKAA